MFHNKIVKVDTFSGTQGTFPSTTIKKINTIQSLLFAAVSSGLPFCKTTLLRKTAHFCNTIGRSFCLVLAIERYIYIAMFSERQAFQNIFQNFLLISEKWNKLQNYSKNIWHSFSIFLARFLIYNFTKSDYCNQILFFCSHFDSEG